MPVPGLQDRFIIWLQSEASGLLPVMEFFSGIGTGALYLIAFALIYWWSNPRFGIRLFVLLNLSAAVNNLLKMALHMPRPYWTDPRVQGIHAHSSFGMPSGHAQSAAVVFGLAGATLKQRWIWAVCATLIFFIGFSRLQLGVHSPVQVLSGWLIGIGLVFWFVKQEKPFLAWFKKRTPWTQAGICAGSTAALILAGLAIQWIFGNFEIPATWVKNAPETFKPPVLANPLSMKNLTYSTAAFFGISVGAVLSAARGGYEPKGPLSHRVLRIFAGFVGLFFLFGIFGKFHGNNSAVANVWGFIRTAVGGLWITGFSPLLFRRLGI